MPITETLFGGLIAVVVLFLAGRRFGLSNYWSAVLGGALPFLAYLGYAASNWPGGDVLAIHMAVFMATSGVLGVFGDMQQRRQGKMHWAPKLIIGFFAFLVVFNAVLLSISSHGVPTLLSGWLLPNPDGQRLHTVFPGVVPHDRNKLYEPHLQRLEKQRSLGWQIALKGFDELRGGVESRVAVTVLDAQGKPLQADTVKLTLWRMANSQDDIRLQLQGDGAGIYATLLKLPDPGRWLAEIVIRRGEDDFLVQRPLFVEEAKP